MRFILFLALLCPALASQAEELTIERLVASPSLDGPAVRGIAFSPDGRRVTYLKGKEDDYRQTDLWSFDPETGAHSLLVDSQALLGGAEEQLDEVEKARRERQRISGTGIVEYYWAPDSRSLLFPLGGDLYYLTLGEAPRRLTETDATETDPKFSPKGRYVSYVREQNLYVYDLTEDRERAITTEGGGTTLFGMAEFVAQEEMGRTTGYWWGPEERRIAYAEIDEAPVDLVNRYELGADDGVTTIEQRYPFAGTDNVKVALRLATLDDLDGDRPALDLGLEEDIYLARVTWHPSGRYLTVQRQDRAQQRLDLLMFDIEQGWRKTLLTETSETWINLNDAFQFFHDGADFLWMSERDGHAHLYRYKTDGGAPVQLTKGDWVVTSVDRLDEDSGHVYVTATKDSPLERHLYRVALDGSGPIAKITQGEGIHRAVIDKQAKRFVDFFSAPQQPPQAILRTMKGGEITALSANALQEGHPYHPYLDGHAARRFGTLEAEDGTPLYYSLRLPADFDPDKRYPVVVNVYGGPGVQRVTKRWTIDFDQILARNGYLVFKLDNRGSTDRGKAFEDHLYRHMGAVEVADQLAGVDYLKSLPHVDGARIGVYGWSYGGYMTLMLLAKAPDSFQAGLSVAPVSDWTLYDTHYTERFLGRPDEGDAYRRSSLFPYIGGIADDRLLLVHGMADDNVFFDHAVKVMSRLQQDRVQFELMTYPGKRHGIRGEDMRAHLWTKALGFFDARLK